MLGGYKMDHGKKYWFKQTYDQQKKDILFEFTQLVERWGKSEHNVNLLMNRCIKYTGYCIEDPKNSNVKSDLEEILEIEKKFKENPHDTDSEKQIYNFFDKHNNIHKDTDKISALKVMADLSHKVSDDNADTIMTIIQYDSNDHPVQALTGSLTTVFSQIENFTKYYYRIAAFKQETIRDRVKVEHFGVNTSCIGGVRFDIAEAMNRYLNYLIREYAKTGNESFFPVLCHFQWYSRLIKNLKKNNTEQLEEQINKIKESYPELKEIDNLDQYKEVSGIYVLVLDDYHVCYVGQAQNIRQRVMQHWSRSNYFTGTGIDLFKPCDTTRIFVLTCEENEINGLEHRLVDMVEARYLLNQFAGGNVQYIIDNDLPFSKDTESDPFQEIFSMFDEIAMFADKFIVRENDFRLHDFEKNN